MFRYVKIVQYTHQFTRNADVHPTIILLQTCVSSATKINSSVIDFKGVLKYVLLDKYLTYSSKTVEFNVHSTKPIHITMDVYVQLASIISTTNVHLANIHKYTLQNFKYAHNGVKLTRCSILLQESVYALWDSKISKVDVDTVIQINSIIQSNSHVN